MIYYPNLYVCLVGPPGGRKGTAMNMAKDLVISSNTAVIASESTTRKALIMELEEAKQEFYLPSAKGLVTMTANMLNVWSEEFAVFLGQRDEEMIPTLTDLFDSPAKWRHRTAGSGITYTENVFLNIIGAATPTLLQDALTRRAFGSGLFSRIIFIVEHGRAKRIPYDTTADGKKTLREDLIHDLQAINQMVGPFRWSPKAMLAYSKWYCDPRSDQGLTDSRFVGYTSRRAVHLRKLAMLISAAKGDEKTVSENDFVEALALLEVAESKMPRLFHGVGKLEDSAFYSEVATYVSSNKGATFDSLLSRFIYDLSKDDLKRILDTLVTAKILVIDKQQKPYVYYKKTDVVQEINDD